MKLSTATLCLLAFLVGSACARQLLAPTPTQQLNAQRQAQQEAAAKAAAARAPAKPRLSPPCFVPSSYYPYQSCGLSQDAGICGRGWNAWKSYAECCAPQRGNVGAFVDGCTDLNKPVTCYVVDTYFPRQACKATNDSSICLRTWGSWPTNEGCCEAGAAFGDGCSLPEPCWTASSFYPERSCAETSDQSVCLRGWGAFPTEDDCCVAGGGFSDGCGPVVSNSGSEATN